MCHTLKGACVVALAVVMGVTGLACAGTTERVSVGQGGAQADGRSEHPSISADGRFVAFNSAARNLVPSDTNDAPDVFVRDRYRGTTERVSVGRKGAEANEASGHSAISADGRFVAFASFASNLVPGDANNDGDVFVYDRQTGKTERVSIGWKKGQQPDGSSGDPAISGDGRTIAFSSFASNLVRNDVADTNGELDLFVIDRRTGKSERASRGLGGIQANGGSGGPSLSADGRFVVFLSSAWNLVPNDTNLSTDAFLYDRKNHAITRVSVGSGGTEMDGTSQRATISANGRFIAFDLLSNSGMHEIFVHDRVAGETTNVIPDTFGCFGSAISPDGRFVTFESWDDHLVPDDSNFAIDVFVTDRRRGRIERVSVGSRGTQGDQASLQPAISLGGRFIAFTSYATRLVPRDTNDDADVFVRAR